MSSDSTVLGVVLLVRHGDRTSFYQDPKAYTPSLTAITPLGNAQEFQLGQQLRQLYFNASSPSHIDGLDTGLFNQTRVRIRADAGGEGGVIFNSALSLVQGIWPPSSGYNITLANGTTIAAPLGGYQGVPIESVEPDNDVTLEGWTKCKTFDKATSTFYDSAEFKAFGNEHTEFLDSLPQYLDGRPVTFQNMWNVFDYMNVQFLHDKAFAGSLPPTYLAQARHLANYHEFGVFSSPQLDSISNIPGRTLISTILDAFGGMVGTSPVKFNYQAISYKPFASLFRMTGVTEAHPELGGIVDFAAALALEVRQPKSGGEPVIRFNFKNGTDSEFKQYNMWGHDSDVPISQFINTLAPVAVNSTNQWCNVCGNTQDRGCAALQLAKAQGYANAKPSISSVGAGFIGAGATIGVFSLVFAALFFLGFLAFSRRRGRKASYEVKA